MESHNANTSSNLSIRPCLPSPRSQHHPAFLENRAIRGRGEVNCEYRSQLLYSYASFLFLSYCYCLHFCLMPTSLPPKQIGRERLERYPRSLNQPLIIIALNFSLSLPAFDVAPELLTCYLRFCSTYYALSVIFGMYALYCIFRFGVVHSLVCCMVILELDVIRCCNVTSSLS